MGGLAGLKHVKPNREGDWQETVQSNLPGGRFMWYLISMNDGSAREEMGNQFPRINVVDVQ